MTSGVPVILRRHAVSQLGIGPKRQGLAKRLNAAFHPGLVVASTACTTLINWPFFPLELMFPRFMSVSPPSQDTSPAT